MDLTQKNFILEKLLKTIRSCRSEGQLTTAKKFFELVVKKIPEVDPRPYLLEIKIIEDRLKGMGE